MSIFNSFGINASGMTAERYRMDVISENVANANTTRTEDGTPYRRKVVTFEQRGERVGNFSTFLGKASSAYRGQGVRVSKVLEDDWTQMNMVYDPSHPDADENGFVTLPNVDLLKETVDSMSATRSYEANVTALNAMKLMAQKALDIGK